MSTPSPPASTEPLNEPEPECAICKDTPGPQAIVIPCEHNFDLVCIRAWINSGSRAATTCPLCRTVMKELHHTPDDRGGSLVEVVRGRPELYDSDDGSDGGYDSDDDGDGNDDSEPRDIRTREELTREEEPGFGDRSDSDSEDEMVYAVDGGERIVGRRRSLEDDDDYDLIE